MFIFKGKTARKLKRVCMCVVERDAEREKQREREIPTYWFTV